MNYDTASPDELRQASYEMQRQAQETGRRFNWADRQRADNGRRPPVAIPINMSAVDWDDVQRHYRVANARREIDREAETSGLAERWRADDERARKSAEGERELTKYWNSLEGSGPLGRLMAGKNVELHDPNIDRPKGRVT
jgi:hypothetical protein